jgi:hypothetical protein
VNDVERESRMKGRKMKKENLDRKEEWRKEI